MSQEPLFAVTGGGLRREGTWQLEPLSFRLARGERLTVLGEAGAGKEALLRLIGGFREAGDEPAGTITFGRGEPLALDSPVYAPPLHLAYLPNPLQNPLAPHAGVAGQLTALLAAKRKIPKPEAREKLRQALARLPGALRLEDLDLRPAKLEAARLALALFAGVIAAEPDLVLAHRPLADLGPKAAKELLPVIAREQERLGFGLIYTTGGLQVPARLGGRVLVLRGGKLVEDSDAATLMEGRGQPYTARYFASLPALRYDSPKPRPSALRGQPLLQIHNLAFGGQGSARDGLTFELRRGAALALAGEPGSGRRKLLRLMLGFDPAPPGRVLFDAVDLNVLSPAMAARMRRRIAVISGKDDYLDPRMTLWDTVEEPLRAHLDLSGELIAGYREAALTRVGLASHQGGRRVASLSPFDKRRLQVARAIVAAPLLVVVDEPQLGLDAIARSVLREVLAGFHANEGPAFLVLTSDLTIAQALAEEAMIFEAGKVVERGPIAKLVREPEADATKALIDAVSLPGLSSLSASV